MYKDFYGLKQNPFSLSPNPDFVCMTAQHREAISGLIYGVCTRGGLTLLVGEVGTGKTTLLYTLLGFLEKRRHIVGLCTNPRLSCAEFYNYILSALEVPCVSSLKSQQLMALRTTLLSNSEAGRPAVLIVDEAQKLDPDLLEEIRLLMNLETPQQKLLHIIMAGQPELDETLRRPEYRQLKQRVNYFCRLKALDLGELEEYVTHRLSRAGLPHQTLFSSAVIQVIYEYTNGIPRLVNTLCDNSLQAGFATNSPQITIPIVHEAAADLDLQIDSRRPPKLARESEGSLPDAARPGMPAGTPPLSPAELSDLDRERRKKYAVRTPLDNYSDRQESLGFLGGLLGRWR